MRRQTRLRCAALVCALVLLLSLCGCGQQASAPGTETPRESAASPDASPAPPAASPAPVQPQESPASDDEDGAEAVFGKPWANSLVFGNVPSEAPDARDDLYLHYNYDTLLGCEGVYYMQMQSNEWVLTDYVLELLMDETRGAPSDAAYTDEELEQLRVFFRQASDLETLTREGISELEPYLERIRAAGTLEELNAVLTSEDFPFSPYLRFTVSAYDMSAKNNVFLWPEFMFVSDTNGAEYLQDSDDPDVTEANLDMIDAGASEVLLSLMALGMPREEALDTLQALFELETAYGKDAGYNDRYLSEPFGALAGATADLSLDELAALCPAFPVRETVVKFGKDASSSFTLFGKDWLSSLNDVWTEDNLELLKTMTMAKLVQECLPYVDARPAAGIAVDPDAVDPLANALNVCNRTDTFTQLFGKIYVSDQYSDAELARLEDLTASLIDAFRRLIDKTDWLSDASKALLVEKLDKMRLNVLRPDGGYLDFSDLELLPTEEGGSLLGNYLRLKAWRNEKDNELLSQDALARIVWEFYYKTNLGNCGYDADTNSINILPGLAASQGYSADTTQEELLGIYGWIIAHEISHGFDFAGAQFDACGRPGGLFSEEELAEYLAVVDRLSAYYDGVEATPGVMLVGERVKTEAAADLIGVQLVLEVAKGLPDFDYEAFFAAYSRYLFLVLPNTDYLPLFLTDEHPLHYLRVNVNAQMYPEFYETYGVREGDGMYLPEAERIRFWG